MNLEVRRCHVFAAPPERVWAILTDMAEMPLFAGWGPIPGIAGADWISGTGAPGSIRAVTNRDGTRHKEEVMVKTPCARIEDRIFDLESPLRMLVREGRDTFALAPESSGTRLDRIMLFELRSPLWLPLAFALQGALGRALDRHHANVAARL